MEQVATGANYAALWFASESLKTFTSTHEYSNEDNIDDIEDLPTSDSQIVKLFIHGMHSIMLYADQIASPQVIRHFLELWNELGPMKRLSSLVFEPHSADSIRIALKVNSIPQFKNLLTRMRNKRSLLLTLPDADSLHLPLSAYLEDLTFTHPHPHIIIGSVYEGGDSIQALIKGLHSQPA
jgi:hypothetical protein